MILIKKWYKRNFCTLNLKECELFNLTFYFNVYGDHINVLDCRSIWKDSKGKIYKCEELYNY